MVSRWYEFKNTAIELRAQGTSIRDIQTQLGVPRSTLSGWLKNVVLTDEQKEKLNEKVRLALINSRKKALKWHHDQKKLRLRRANDEAEKTLKNIDINDLNILELALSFLYLGEGSKKSTTSLGNTNPLILNFFIKSVRKVFPNSKLGKFELHLRSDQNEKKEIDYWSKKLNIDKRYFTYVKDKRVARSKTYSDYHGVCVVRFTEVSIQRRLVFLSHKFCNIITELDP